MADNTSQPLGQTMQSRRNEKEKVIKTEQNKTKQNNQRGKIQGNRVKKTEKGVQQTNNNRDF